MLQPDMTEYLPRHDLVYLSPPRHGWEAFPLGNGSLGGPLWACTDGLSFQANHTDAYELPDPEKSDEGWALLRSCGRLMIHHAVPYHDWMFLNDYEARLSLHDATARLAARTAFGDFETTAYVHAAKPVAVFEHRAAYSQTVGGSGAPVRIALERWGSRVPGWWYASIQGGASIGLGRTRAFVDDGDICLEVSLRGMKLALRCRIVGATTTARVLHDHRVELEVPATREQRFRVLLACVTSHEAADPTAAARAAIESAAKEIDLAHAHRRWWADYWQRSFLHVTPDYFENLYYLHLYLMGSCARGKYPPLFNGGLWIWNRDVRNWAMAVNWNEQQAHWCLPAANRTDLLHPYLDTYWRLMPEGLALAKRSGFDGLLWSEAHDFTGRQLGEHNPHMRDNFTPAAQIAMFFWWHYQFTGDADYLQAKGYPYLRAVGDFYLRFLRWVEERQQYEIPPASTYEDERTTSDGRPLRFTDSITTLAMVRALMRILLQTSEILDLDADKRTRWRHVLEHLPPYRLNDRDTARGVTLASGLVAGKELPAREDHNHGPLFCPVFPAGDLSLKDAGTPVFSAAQNTLATYPPACNAITPTVLIAARLGMADEAQRRLDAMVRHLQQFPNGMFFNIDHWFTLSRRVSMKLADWGGRDEMAAYQRDYIEDRGCRFLNVSVAASPADGVPEHRADTPTWPFTQPGLESLGHFAAGLQEMLLQSHEGVIRVFPAVPDDWEAAFVLLAEGGFQVASRRQHGQPPMFITIFSRRGGACRVVGPWPDGAQVWDDQRQIIAQSVGKETIQFSTQAGERYLLGPSGCPPPVVSFAFAALPNAAPKRYGEAMIGKPHDY